MTQGTGPAEPGELSETARWLVGLLRPLTPFAEAIVRRQAERAGIPPGALGPEHVGTLAPMIVSATQMFVDPGRVALLRSQLSGL